MNQGGAFMTELYTYEAKGTVDITQLVYEYGEEDPVEEIDLTLVTLTEKEFHTLQQVLANEEDLAAYIWSDSILYGIVKEIRLGVGKEGSLTEIRCTKPITTIEEQTLIDYLSGQFSDGWGEGFYQHPFYEDDKVLIAGFNSVQNLARKKEVDRNV